MKGMAVLLLVLLLVLAGGGWARTAAPVRGPVRLDDADLNATRSLIEHDMGNVRTTLSNFGAWGNPDFTPGFHGWEWPAASGNNLLFSAGLWVGALLDSVHRVSTTVDGDNGTGEFWPEHIGTRPPENSDADWWTLSYCLNEYHGRHYLQTDTAHAFQEFYAVFQDSISLGYVQSPDADGHRPLNIEISQRSYCWPGYLARDIVFVDYRIRNRGAAPLHHLYLGLFADPDIGAAGETGDNASAHDGNYYDPQHVMALQGKYDFWNGAYTPGLFAMKVTGTPVPLEGLRVTFRNFSRLGGGDPTVDADKYYLMSAGTQSPQTSYIDDWRMLLSFGANATDGFDLPPDSVLRISVAFLSGANLDSINLNAERAQSIFNSGYNYRPPAPAPNFRQTFTASGLLQLAWSAPAGGYAGFNLFGRDSGGTGEQIQFNTAMITDTSDLLLGMQNGMDWLFQLQTVNASGETSIFAETLCRVAAPATPTGLLGGTANGTVTLHWNPNPEPNITGYRVTRTTVYSRASGGDSLVTATFDTPQYFYEDNSAPRGRDNIYRVQALNSLGVYSFYSSTVSYIPFAPQHRVLVLDVTAARTSWPSQVDVRAFYEGLLGSLGEAYDYRQDSTFASIELLAQYDLVLWHNENLGMLANDEATLQQYMRAGGRLLRSGTLLVQRMLSGSYGYGMIRESPSLLQPLTFDSLWITRLTTPHTEIQLAGGTASQPGFPSFQFNSTKICSLRWGNFQFCYLPMMDLLWPNGETHALYRTAVTPADTSGRANQPCAVIGPREILLAFPLYLLYENDARQILNAGLDTLRTMVMAAGPKPAARWAVPTSISLQPCYPNPFNPITVLRFDLDHNAAVRLSVYDVLGREVAVLLNGEVTAGAHEVRWNAREQASGVYFAVLEAGHERQAQKLVLLK